MNVFPTHLYWQCPWRASQKCSVGEHWHQLPLHYQGVQRGGNLKLADNLIGNNLTRAMTPAIPPRKSSEQSTVDLHKQIALQDSSNTVETAMKGRQGSDRLHRDLSAERDLHQQQKAPATPSGRGQGVDQGTPPTQNQQQLSSLISSKVSFPRGFFTTAALLLWHSIVTNLIIHVLPPNLQVLGSTATVSYLRSTTAKAVF